MQMNSIPTDLTWKTLYSGDPQDGWLHSGIAVLSDGALAFEAPGGGALMMMNPIDGSSSKVAVRASVLHGITAVDGRDELWICDPGVYSGPPAGQVLLVNRQGEVLRKIFRPGLLPDDAPTWKPTSLAIHHGDIWIADGYGESLVHRIRPDGSTQTFDGAASGTRFDCPHGVAIDTRAQEPLVVIADRGNERIVVMTLDGEYVRTIKSSQMVGPSSIAIRGNHLFVTDLFGAILSIDKNDQVVVHVSAAKSERGEGWPNRIVDGLEVAPEVVEGAVNSPHGIAVTSDSRVIFTEWYLGGRVVQLY